MGCRPIALLVDFLTMRLKRFDMVSSHSKILFLVLICCMFLFSGCQRGGDDTGKDSTPANETFWQLLDDSDLTVRVFPWPPKASSKTTIRAEASSGDWSEEAVLTENVMFGVTRSESEKVTKWTPMRTVKTETYTKYFSADVTLPQGKIYLHFDARGDAFSQESKERGGPYVLDPWEITVEK